MDSLLEVLRKTEAFFAKKEVPSPRLNAELIFAHVLKCPRLRLYLEFDRPLSADVLDRARPLVARRAQREPLQYVLGQTEFADLTLSCDRRALIPRPETEELFELLKTRLAATPPRSILDLGTGTGALALALARAFPDAEVWAADLSADALALARENAARNALSERVRFFESDWYAGLPEHTFDLIVSNPPYLTAEETESAAPEVRAYEPHGALTAANNGLADLRKIFSGAPARLNPNGLLATETGIAHHAALEALAESLGFKTRESRNDLSHRPRFYFAQK